MPLESIKIKENIKLTIASENGLNFHVSRLPKEENIQKNNENSIYDCHFKKQPNIQLIQMFATLKNKRS